MEITLANQDNGITTDQGYYTIGEMFNAAASRFIFEDYRDNKADNTITRHKKELKNLNLRRRSAGDLFYTFIKLLDNLISPSCIVLDPDMVFTDPEGITIKLCCLPLKIDPAELCLSSLDASKLERLLNCDFFKSILTDDEINTLVFSVRENTSSTMSTDSLHWLLSSIMNRGSSALKSHITYK